MKISKYRNSQWLKKDDVEEMAANKRTTTVDRIAEELVGEDVKPVLYLKGISKGWPCNLTALDSLAELSGSDDTDDFDGTPVEIYVDPDVRYAGKRVGGIKLRRPGGQHAASEAFQAPPDAQAESQAAYALDDELTF